MKSISSAAPRSETSSTVDNIVVPPPPLTTTPRRKASGPFLENPHRKWQRRQIGDQLFDSAKSTPERAPEKPKLHGRSFASVCAFDQSRFAPSTRGSQNKVDKADRVLAMDTVWPESSQCDLRHCSCDHHSNSTSADDFPPGTALPYAPEPFPQSPAPPSSVYSETPATPSSLYRRNHSYRSYSGRAMYSPANFPLSSSPYGTPTIRMVGKSALDLGGGTRGKKCSEHSPPI